MAKQEKVHPSVKDLNRYGNSYEGNPQGSNQKTPVTNQHPSVSQVHRPDLAPNSGGWYDSARGHITGPASDPNPVGYVANRDNCVRRGK